MANLSHYCSDALAEVHNHNNVDNNVINQGVQVMPSSKQSNVVNHSETEITSDSNIIPYFQYVTELQHAAVQNSNSSAQQAALILSVIEQLKSQCLKLETELLNKKDFIKKETYDKTEIFQRDNSVSNQSALSFDQYFELNEMKAQSQEKDTVIKKLKERIKSLSGNMNEEKVKMDIEEIETINIGS
ncbi:hypothetical protein Tco_0196503 [Tanacetum coccineum]